MKSSFKRFILIERYKMVATFKSLQTALIWYLIRKQMVNRVMLP